MKQIKIIKQFWNKIVSGEKRYEFRKLEKGLTTGTYEFVSVEGLDYKGTLDEEYFPDERFGTAHLKPIAINPEFSSDYNNPDLEPEDYTYWFTDNRYNQNDIESDVVIDKGTYNFVLENYVDKNIDFVVYEISNVKKGGAHDTK